jgi:hypothetical protein
MTASLPERLHGMSLKQARLSQFIIELPAVSYSGKGGVSLQGAG